MGKLSSISMVASNDSFTSVTMQFIIQNGSQYYVSDTPMALYSPSIDSITDARWLTWNPTPTTFDPPSGLGAKVTFNDVQQVGFLVSYSGQYSRNIDITSFTATTAVGP